MTHSMDDLRMMQALPLDIKVRMTEQRIRQWVNEFGKDGVCISFSGGKDSTVLMDIARGIYPDLPAIFINTGLEYPEVVQFVKTFSNVEILRPKMSFKQVVEKYGYPFISKEVSQHVFDTRKAGRGSLSYQKLTGTGKYQGSEYSSPKYEPLLDADYMIGSYCCRVMKKGPKHSYETRTGRKNITGQMAHESRQRLSTWLKFGCNAFDAKTPTSNPIAFWTDQDVLRYIKEHHLPIASVYGDIVAVDADGYEYDSLLTETCQLKTTGCQRTGCIFCGFGAHLEKGESRFQRLKRTHPKLYDYCMGGGAYDSDGLWKPTAQGLGMAHVIDDLCRRYGDDFIKY